MSNELKEALELLRRFSSPPYASDEMAKLFDDAKSFLRKFEKPYLAYCVRLDEFVIVTFAQNKSKAKYTILKAVRDAMPQNCMRDLMTSTKAVRMPQHDHSFKQDYIGKVLCGEVDKLEPWI